MSTIAGRHELTGHAARAIPTHCVFRHGTAWLALPAAAIREVMPRPEMVAVPGTPATIVGLCHIRSQFIPVLSLGPLLNEVEQTSGAVMLMIDDGNDTWAFLVDEVLALQHLEISDSAIDDDDESIVIGWSTAGQSIIRVLDHRRFRSRAEDDLRLLWESGNPLRHHGHRPTSATSAVHS